MNTLASMLEMAARENARVRKVWGQGNPQSQRSDKGARSIISKFAEENGVAVRDLTKKATGRSPEAKAMDRLRWACWAKLRSETKLSYPQIAKLFGGRHHTTIIAGIEKHKRQEQQ